MLGSTYYCLSFYHYVQNPTPDESYWMLEGRCKIDAK